MLSYYKYIRRDVPFLGTEQYSVPWSNFTSNCFHGKYRYTIYFCPQLLLWNTIIYFFTTTTVHLLFDLLVAGERTSVWRYNTNSSSTCYRDLWGHRRRWCYHTSIATTTITSAHPRVLSYIPSIHVVRTRGLKLSGMYRWYGVGIARLGQQKGDNKKYCAFFVLFWTHILYLVQIKHVNTRSANTWWLQ